MLKRSVIERASSSRTRSIVLSELSFKSLAMSTSSEKPSSKLDGARRMPSDGDGALCAKDGGETGASCAMSKWRMSCSVRVQVHALANPMAVADVEW
jgi:hypothetical protein